MDSATYSRIKKMSPQFIVADINRSLDFYTKQLGFDIEFRYEDFYVGISKDGCSIHIKSGKPSPEERAIKSVNENLDIVFSVNNIEELYKDISGKLVEIETPLRTMPYGKEFYITDPDGYRLAFVEEV